MKRVARKKDDNNNNKKSDDDADLGLLSQNPNSYLTKEVDLAHDSNKETPGHFFLSSPSLNL